MLIIGIAVLIWVSGLLLGFVVGCIWVSGISIMLDPGSTPIGRHLVATLPVMRKNEHSDATTAH